MGHINMIKIKWVDNIYADVPDQKHVVGKGEQ